MLEKPDVQDEQLIACLQTNYGLPVVQITFLPLGADLNTAVYRVVTNNGTSYFLKLRWGFFDETSVTLPKFLHDQGIRQIIPPLANRVGGLWTKVNDFRAILYPFVAGQNGYEVDLSDCHWIDFGVALKRIHTAELPPALFGRLQPESYPPQGRETVRLFLERVEVDTYTEPIAVRTATFLRARRAQILDIVERAERLAEELQAQAPELVLCHSDLHAGNLLIEASGALYIVDWDDPILAPKERDLMFVGGGQFGNSRTPLEEEALFYQGYGRTLLNPVALAYYRYERIIQDIAVECEHIFLTNEGDKDREQSLHYLMSNFQPNSVLEVAYRSDKTGERINGNRPD